MFIYTYDIVVRTNLSSFWDMLYLFALIQLWEEYHIATGIPVFDEFISGTGIIMSKDVADKLSESSIVDGVSKEYDDVLISNSLEKITSTSRLPLDLMYYLIDGPNNIYPSDTSKILYYRVKSRKDRNYDLIAFKRLLKLVYNIVVE